MIRLDQLSGILASYPVIFPEIKNMKWDKNTFMLRKLKAFKQLEF